MRVGKVLILRDVKALSNPLEYRSGWVDLAKIHFWAGGPNELSEKRRSGYRSGEVFYDFEATFRMTRHENLNVLINFEVIMGCFNFLSLPFHVQARSGMHYEFGMSNL